MKIQSVKRVHTDAPIAVYDVMNVPRTHNFLVQTNTGAIVSHNCGILDEVNFSKGADPSLVKNKVLETYNACFGRIKNRFTINGKCQGRIFLVSSRKTEYDFLNQYIAKKQASVEDSKNLYVADAKAFEVKPKGSYSGRMFRVAVGGSNLPSKIPEDDESTEDLVHQGYVVYDVPVELRGDFELDINRFIGDHLGIAVSEVTKFIPFTKLEPNYKEIKNPFMYEVCECNLSDNMPVKTYFNADVVPEEVSSKPIFIHLDTSGGKGDNTGISAIAAMGFVNRNRYSEESGNVETTKLMLYRQIFTVGLTAKKTSEISFQKIVDFLWHLKFVCGWNIYAVSTDGYMGQFLRQQIAAAGFNEVNYVSLDRTPDGYLTFQTILAEQRISLMKLELLETEIVRLERNNISGKIDHPLDGCFTGDTKISLVDGRDLTILELKKEFEEGKVNYVYACDEATHQTQQKPIINVFWTKRSELLEIELNTGDTIRCTPDHRFMLLNGDYVRACTLRPGNELMSVNRFRAVAAVREIDEAEDVYDLTIKDIPNFALAAGVFVHNSKDLADSLAGAVYNCTLHEATLTTQFAELFESILEANTEQPTPQETKKIITDVIERIKGETDAEAYMRRKANYESYMQQLSEIRDSQQDYDDNFII